MSVDQLCSSCRTLFRIDVIYVGLILDSPFQVSMNSNDDSVGHYIINVARVCRDSL
jgi:hypothetical protein